MAVAFVSAMERVPWGGSEELWYGAALQLAGDGIPLAISYKDWNSAVVHKKLDQLEQSGATVGKRKLETRWDRWTAKVLRRKLAYAADQLHREWRQVGDISLVVISQGNFKDGAWAMQAACDASIPYIPIVQANAEFLWPSDELNQQLIPLYQGARKIFCVSQANLDLLQKQLATDLPQAEVVFNPFNVRWEAEVEWPDASQEWSLACVARMEPDAKGQDLILEALSDPKWKDRPLSVHFYGTGASSEGLIRYSKNLGLTSRQVHFHGQVSSIEGIWKRHHGLILTSRYEGLPLALVEAMLCGRMPIVTDVAGAAELTQHGKNGYLIPAPRTSMVQDTLEAAWQNRQAWRDLGQMAQLTARAKIPKNPCKTLAEKIQALAQSGSLKSMNSTT